MIHMLTGMALTLSAMIAVPVHAQSAHHAHGQSLHHAHEQPAGHGMHAAHGQAQPAYPDAATAARPEGVVVEGCWVRALPNRLPSAGYFRIRNAGGKEAVLTGAQAPGFGQVMLHTHQTVNGMSTMVHVDKVNVPAGGSFDFAPGGHHLMLVKPEGDLQAGSRLPVTLWFEGNRALVVDCDVRGPSAMK